MILNENNSYIFTYSDRILTWTNTMNRPMCYSKEFSLDAPCSFAAFVLPDSSSLSGRGDATWPGTFSSLLRFGDIELTLP
eukprot:g16169.t1